MTCQGQCLDLKCVVTPMLTKIILLLQLSELNQMKSSDVQWEITGNKVIPKTLNVAKVTAGSFEKTITFKQVRRELTKAAFNRG
jgi:hypothetical protein